MAEEIRVDRERTTSEVVFLKLTSEDEKPARVMRLVDQIIKDEGVEYVFGLTGHGFALEYGVQHLGIKRVHVRHECTAAFAADAVGRITGKAGVFFTAAGPAITNAMTGLIQAKYAQSPVVGFLFEHDTLNDGRGTLQEGYSEPLTKSICKWSYRIASPRTFVI